VTYSYRWGPKEGYAEWSLKPGTRTTHAMMLPPGADGDPLPRLEVRRDAAPRDVVPFYKIKK
jgi:hypothetical protein